MNEIEYEKALKRAEELIDLNPEIGSELGNELSELCERIEAYEEEHYPVGV